MQNDKQTISQDKAKDAGLALVLASMLLFQYFKLKVFFLMALGLLLISMTYPPIFKPWARLWFGLSELMGKCVSTVIIGIAFFGVVTPIGILRRMVGKDSLMLHRWKNGTDSVMRERNHLFRKEDLKRPF